METFLNLLLVIFQKDGYHILIDVPTRQIPVVETNQMVDIGRVIKSSMVLEFI